MVKYKKLENVKFLTDLIPPHWIETVEECDMHYMSTVKGQYVSDKEWNKVVDLIRNEFGENLIEIYSHSSNGVCFEVFLKK